MTHAQLPLTPHNSIIVLSVKSEADMSSWDIGRRFFQILEDPSHDLSPDQLWRSDPGPKVRYTGVESARDLWTPLQLPAGAYTPKWSRTRPPKCDGNMKHIFVRKDGRTVPGGPDIFAAPDANVDWIGLLRDICKLLDATDAFIDVIEERSELMGSSIEDRFGQEPWIRFRGHSACLTRKLVSDDILSAIRETDFPHEMDDDHLLVSVSKSVFDVFSDHERYRERQLALSRLLNPNAKKLLKSRWVGNAQWEQYESDE